MSSRTGKWSIPFRSGTWSRLRQLRADFLKRAFFVSGVRDISAVNIYFAPRLALIALLLGGGAHGISAEPGVVSVSANADQIGLTLQGGTRELEVVELGPHQFARDAASAPVVLRIEPGQESKISTPRFKDGRDRLYDGFMARVPGGETVGPLRHVEELRGVSKNADPIPPAASRKGLQVQMTDDAIALGIKHAAINVDLASLIDPAGAPDSLAWPMDGTEFHFRRPLVERNDKTIAAPEQGRDSSNTDPAQLQKPGPGGHRDHETAPGGKRISRVRSGDST